MPEIPEIEAVLQYLYGKIRNDPISSVQTFQHTVIRTPNIKEFPKILLGAYLTSIQRIGKILKLNLKRDEKFIALYLDHGLTGRLAWKKGKRATKTVLEIGFESGKELLYHDKRLHGSLWLYQATAEEDLEIPEKIMRFGPDIKTISEEEFLERIKRYRGEIKGVITNQSFITGIGNAYSDEILFDAGIHPFTKKPQLSKSELLSLFRSSKSVIGESIESIYKMLIETEKINNQRFWRSQLFKIHLRGGEPCVRCGNKISTIKAHRLTNFCRKCQKTKNKSFI
ncbi:MAG: DNA-formamidopyrimidine glycosylase family protein [Candidatus Hodarchaeales archaeon]|jgi:formamidopyrimidine-DNA glycosylase